MQIIHAWSMLWNMTGNAPITPIEMLTLFTVTMLSCHVYHHLIFELTLTQFEGSFEAVKSEM